MVAPTMGRGTPGQDGPDHPARLRVRIETRIGRVDRAGWDRLDHAPSPFLRHGFLTALEESGSVGRGSWEQIGRQTRDLYASLLPQPARPIGRDA